MLLHRNLSRVWGCTSQEWRLLINAVWSLALARSAVTFLPFRRIAAGLGDVKTEFLTTDVGENPEIEQIRWAIQAISCRLPGTRQCLVQGLAAKWMLQRRRIPSTLYFGVAKDSAGNLLAHAWLRSGSQMVTGAEGRKQYAVVASFADPQNPTKNTAYPSDISP